MCLCGGALPSQAASYALQHPSRVSRLVLVAPVGLRRAAHLDHFIESLARRAPRLLHSKRGGRDLLERITRSTQQAHLTPQSFVRAVGLRLGNLMVSTARSRDRERYGFPDNRVCEYLYHISAMPPSGELAWNRLLPPILDTKWSVAFPPSLFPLGRSFVA